jgi:hypothetical protein
VIGKDVVNGITPAVVSTLEDVEATLKSTVSNVTSALSSIAVPLAQNEYAGLVTTLKTLNTFVSGLESSVGNIVKNVPAGKFQTITNTLFLSNSSLEVKPLIANEVNAVMDLVSPLVNPLTDFATKVAGNMVNDKELTAIITGLATGADTIVGALVDPVSGAVKDILS